MLAQQVVLVLTVAIQYLVRLLRLAVEAAEPLVVVAVCKARPRRVAQAAEAVATTQPVALERLIKVMQVVQQVRFHHLIIRAVVEAEQAALLVLQLVAQPLVAMVERVSLHQSQAVVLLVQAVAVVVLKLEQRVAVEPAVVVLETRVERLVLLEQLILAVAVAQDLPLLVQVDLA